MIDHVKVVHKDSWQETVNLSTDGGGPMDRFIEKIPERAKDAFQWMLAVVEEAEPFLVVEKSWFAKPWSN